MKIEKHLVYECDCEERKIRFLSQCQNLGIKINFEKFSTNDYCFYINDDWEIESNSPDYYYNDMAEFYYYTDEILTKNELQKIKKD